MPKLVKIGSSVGVTIPPEQLKELGLSPGDEVVIRTRGSLLEVVPVVKRPKLRPSLQAAVDLTIEEYGPALEQLAK